MRRVGIVRDQRFLAHRTGVHHVETPQRLAAIYDMLDKNGLQKTLSTVPARFATLEEVSAVHSTAYIEKILDTAGEPLRYLDPDTVTSERTCEAAFIAAGSVIEAVDAVLTDRLNTVFAFLRPPGHHAERNRQMGFCIFNNVAIAAEHARRVFGLERILVVDWDVHHPNGTQHIFETTPEVLLFSTHRFPFFPGTGDVNETGRGDGQGYTVNVPLSAGRTDADVVSIYRELFIPVTRAYAPELILVSAGFDIHRDDPIGGMRVSEHGFSRLTDLVLTAADTCCRGRAVFVLEGGYDLSAVRKSTKAMLETMQSGLPETPEAKPGREADTCGGVADVIDTVKATLKPYWKCF